MFATYVEFRLNVWKQSIKSELEEHGENMKGSGAQVFVKVQEGWPVAKSIRNIIAMRMAMSILAKPLEMVFQINFDEEILCSMIFQHFL